MSAPRPNILVITCHDLGRHLGCYGIEEVHSPNIDRLATQGVRFANSFCTAPQCSPSRASMFTGRYPHSNGVMGLCHGLFGWDLHPGERHLAQRLGEVGYHTIGLGVIHESGRPDALGFHQVDRRRDHEVVVAQIREHLARRRPGHSPFYLQAGFFEPHRAPPAFGQTPDRSQGVHIPPYLVDDPDAREDFAGFQGAIRHVDATIGRILALLDEYEHADNTLVIMTTDHGIPFPRAKCSLYDPGLETCLIMRWPDARWRPGLAIDAMVSNVDYVPTILDLLELPVPEAIQGQSFAPLLKHAATGGRQEIFGEMTYHEYCDPCRCIRTAEHKLIVNFTTAPSFMDPSQAWRRKTITRVPVEPSHAYHPPVELYDLGIDPLEHVNLADDPAHAAIRRDLLDRLHQWMADTQDPLLAGIPLPPSYHRALEALTGH